MNTELKKMFKNCTFSTFNNDEQWHELRSKGLGGSDIASVLDENKYKSKHQLWLEKTNRVKPQSISNEAIEKGKRLEPVLTDLFYKLHIHEVKKTLSVKDISLSRVDKPYMRANLDGAYIDTNDELCILEIKTSTIQNLTMLEQWGIDEEGNEKIPFNYYCQCLWYMLVTGATKVTLFALLDIPWGKLSRQETRIATIKKEDVLQDMEYIEQCADVFWKTVKMDIEPPIIETKFKL